MHRRNVQITNEKLKKKSKIERKLKKILSWRFEKKSQKIKGQIKLSLDEFISFFRCYL